MAKRDGSYYLAFWAEGQDYDVNKHMETPVGQEKVTLASSPIFKTAQLFEFNADGSIKTRKLTPSREIPLIATDCITILRLQ